MYFSFGQILNLFYGFRPSFCVLFVLLLDRLSGEERVVLFKLLLFEFLLLL